MDSKPVDQAIAERFAGAYEVGGAWIIVPLK